MAEYIVAIDVTRVRFPADAHCQYQNKLIGVAFDCNSFVFLYRGRDNIYQIYQGLATMQHMRMPGVEPGSQVWEACMMPLHYMRLIGFIFRDVVTRLCVLRHAMSHIWPTFSPCFHASHPFRGEPPYCPILFHERASLPSPIFLWGAPSAHGELHCH